MLPLKDKTILITRSANQAAGFINQLKELGAKAITLPLIKNTAINQKELIAKLNHNYDWIIFTSANAVLFFFKEIKPEEISSKIAVVGTKTGETLKKLGVKIDFTPSQFTAKFLAEEIPISANDTVLIPRSNLAKDDIVEVLEKRNCTVEPISIYQNSSINYSADELDKVFNQKIDFITFTSGSTAKAFAELNVKYGNSKIICIGPETAIVVKKYNMTIAAIAKPHTIDGMIEAMVSSSASDLIF